MATGPAVAAGASVGVVAGGQYTFAGAGGSVYLPQQQQAEQQQQQYYVIHQQPQAGQQQGLPVAPYVAPGVATVAAAGAGSHVGTVSQQDAGHSLSFGGVVWNAQQQQQSVGQQHQQHQLGVQPYYQQVQAAQAVQPNQQQQPQHYTQHPAYGYR